MKLDLEKFSDAMADVASDNTHPVPPHTNRRGAQSPASVVPSSGADDADMVAISTHIQELQTEKEDLLPRHAGSQK